VLSRISQLKQVRWAGLTTAKICFSSVHNSSSGTWYGLSVQMIRFVAAISILGLVVRASNIRGATTDAGFSPADFQRRLLMGGGGYILHDEQSFADQLRQSSRRTQFAVECPLILGKVNYFDITVQLTPQLGQHGICPLAEQNMLGNDINAILLEYGVGDAGVDTGAIFLAGVCTVPTITNRRRLSSLATGFLWTGVGGCRKGTCKADNSDQRMLAGVGSIDSHRDLASSWFLDTFKPQLEATLEQAFATDLVPKYTACLGSDPGIAVTVNGITRAQLLAVECASSDIGVLDTMSFANLAISSRRSVCSKCVKIDFTTKGNGTALVRGEYVKDQWKKNGLTITAQGGYSPNGTEARIFDTARLGVNGNPDLGSPNEKCGGPGKGRGGQPGMKGENCKALGSKYNVICRTDPICKSCA
jgi:hypothetical protein